MTHPATAETALFRARLVRITALDSLITRLTRALRLERN